MKKVIVLMTAVLFAGVLTTQAQGGGGGQRRTVEERVKAVMEKLADFKLDKDHSTQTEAVFTDYYKTRDKMMQDAMAGGQPNREEMREKGQKLSGERDEKLKKIFTEEQFKKWKDEIEPTLRPQRGGGNN